MSKKTQAERSAEEVGKGELIPHRHLPTSIQAGARMSERGWVAVRLSDLEAVNAGMEHLRQALEKEVALVCQLSNDLEQVRRYTLNPHREVNILRTRLRLERLDGDATPSFAQIHKVAPGEYVRCHQDERPDEPATIDDVYAWAQAVCLECADMMDETIGHHVVEIQEEHKRELARQVDARLRRIPSMMMDYHWQTMSMVAHELRKVFDVKGWHFGGREQKLPNRVGIYEQGDWKEESCE